MKKSISREKVPYRWSKHGLDMEKIAETMGAELVGPVHVNSGAYGMVALAQQVQHFLQSQREETQEES
jgi:hypothetical protein